MRVNIKQILADPQQRRSMMAHAIVALQAREGIETTLEQAYAAYDSVFLTKRNLAAILPVTGGKR